MASISVLTHKKVKKKKKKVIIIKSSDPLIFQGECRQLSFPANYMFGNRRLVKHVIATVEVVDLNLCELQCYHQPNCVSINFNVISDSDRLHECELNNATHRSHDSKLMNRDDYVYKGAEVRNFNILLSFVEKKKYKITKTSKLSSPSLFRYQEDLYSASGMSLRLVRIHASVEDRSLKFSEYEFVFVSNVCPVKVNLSIRFVLKFVFMFTSKFVHVTFTLYSFIFLSDSCWSSNSCSLWAHACFVNI